MKEYLTITEAAKKLKKTRAAIFAAIKNGNLKSVKGSYKHTIARPDLEEYVQNRYSSKKRNVNGEKVYDISKGRISINEAATLMNVTYQWIVYRVRCGRIPSYKMGTSTFLNLKEVEEYCNSLKNKPKKINLN